MTPGSPSRRIVSLMAFAVIFSVIGDEIGNAKLNQNQTSTAVTDLSSPAKIILGGTIATALLSFLAEAGDIGATWATGLAGTACLTSVLIKGAPVWDGISNILKSSNSSGTPTTPTTPTMKAA
jgi:hypothetical protein